MGRSSSVGVRHLRNHLSRTLARVRDGETLVVTDREVPVAVLTRILPGNAAELLRALVRTGQVAWAGGKPRGAARPPRGAGPTVADAVIEDRR